MSNQSDTGKTLDQVIAERSMYALEEQAEQTGKIAFWIRFWSIVALLPVILSIIALIATLFGYDFLKLTNK
jgi:hypothetical protein